MLGSAQANSFCSKGDSYGRLVRLIGIGSNAEFSRFIRPLHEKRKILINLRL